MKWTDFQASLRARGPETWLAVLGLGIALSPTNTKVAGAAWLLVCVAGAVAFFRSPRTGPFDPADPVAAASKAWLMACAASAGLATAVWWYWPQRPDTLHAEFRLLLAAVATHQLIRRAPCPEKWRAFTLPATALACVAAFLMIAVMQDRMAMPSNPIPWAAGMALLLCVVLPPALAGDMPQAQRKVYFVCIALGISAIFLSQSRGAYGIVVWAVWLGALNWRRTHARADMRRFVVAVSTGFALLASTAGLPGDPLRLRKGWNEVVMASHEGNYNSSMGARVYLWKLGWEGFRESPWVGIGGAERLKRIKAAGAHLPAPESERFKEVRNVGHVHNQYLHAAMDGGLIGLAAALAVLAGLGVAALRLWRADPVASRQMQGVLFIHATASLTNVNLAHNYYAVMLALSVALILGGAGARSAPALSPLRA